MAADPAEFTSLFRQFRQRRRRAQGRRLAYTVYVGLLALAVYGGPAIARAVRSLQATHHPDLTTTRIDAAAPYALVGLALFVLAALSRQALWRGPVVMSEADAAWLLSLPVSRRRILLPRYLASGALALLIAVILGVTAAVVLHAYALGSIGSLIAVSLSYSVALALLGLGGAAMIERSPATAGRVRRSRALALLAAVGFAVLAAHAAAQDAQQSTAPITQRFELYPRLALGVVAIAVAIYGGLATMDIPAVALRQRAAVGSAVSTATYVIDLRRARLAVRGATQGRRRGLRLRPPRRSGLAIPWRDLTNVTTSPGSFGWAAGWIALGAAAFATAARQSVDGRHELFPLAIAMICGYVAAVPYSEPTRLEADDFRRVRWSPYPIRGLTMRHAITPAVLAAAGQLIGAAVALIWLDGRAEVLALSLAVATGPVLAVAALLSAFRGAMPIQLIFGGPDFGFGGVGPVLLVFWYLVGPIAAVGLGTVAALPVLHAYHAGSSAMTGAIESLIIGGIATAVLITWAQQRAHQRFAQ